MYLFFVRFIYLYKTLLVGSTVRTSVLSLFSTFPSFSSLHFYFSCYQLLLIMVIRKCGFLSTQNRMRLKEDSVSGLIAMLGIYNALGGNDTKISSPYISLYMAGYLIFMISYLVKQAYCQTKDFEPTNWILLLIEIQDQTRIVVQQEQYTDLSPNRESLSQTHSVQTTH